MKVLAIVPISHTDSELDNGRIDRLGKKTILDWTINSLLAAVKIDKIIVATDSDLVAKEIQNNSNVSLFYRDPVERSLGLVSLYQDILRGVQLNKEVMPEWIAQFWINYPFRAQGLIDHVIETVFNSRQDSAFLATPEYSTYWKINQDGESTRISTDSLIPRYKRPPVYRDLRGLCSMSKTVNIYNNVFLGPEAVVLPINYFGCSLNLHNDRERKMAHLLVDNSLWHDTLKNDVYFKRPDNIVINGREEPTKRQHKSIVFNRAVKKGEVITREHLIVGDSDIGLSESLLPHIVNKVRVLYDFKSGDPLTFGVVEWISQ